jgi:hypothetical protein
MIALAGLPKMVRLDRPLQRKRLQRLRERHFLSLLPVQDRLDDVRFWITSIET